MFLAALDTGLMTASSVVNDAPVVMHDGSSLWRPVNSSGDFLGPMRLRAALARSRNLVTIRVLQTLGLDNTIRYLEGFGFASSRLPRGLSLALGSADLTPLEMTNAYAVLANGGYQVAPWFIERVTRGSDEQVIEEARPAVACRDCSDGQSEVEIDGRLFPVAPRVADPIAVYILRDMLRDVIESGTGRSALSLNRRDVVGKTGTTNNQRDGWFAGYNSDLVVTVWIGKDNNESIAEYGGVAALPIWIDFMGNALNGRPEAMPQAPWGWCAHGSTSRRGGAWPTASPAASRKSSIPTTCRSWNPGASNRRSSSAAAPRAPAATKRSSEAGPPRPSPGRGGVPREKHVSQAAPQNGTCEGSSARFSGQT